MTPEQVQLEKKAFEEWWKQQARPGFADDGFQHDAGSRAWLVRSQIAEARLQRIRELAKKWKINIEQNDALYAADLPEVNHNPTLAACVGELEKELKDV